MEILELDLILIAVAGGLLLLYAVMIIYFLVGWVKTKSVKQEGLSAYNIRSANLPSVSIVLPVRNEEHNIVATLQSIFDQDYPKQLYEIILVDDYSTDATLRTAREMDFGGLKVFDLQNYLGARGEKKPNKKEALAIGIKNAQGDLIITTDGDCTRGNQWLSSMVDFYQSNKYKLVTAPVVIKPAYTPLQVLQQMDVINMMGITAATISNGAPSMCNGANLMYAKQTFLDVDGFKGNQEVASGDDVFLMQKVHKAYGAESIGFVKNQDAWVVSKAEKGLFRFLAQRMRWAGKNKLHSSWWVKLLLTYAYLFNTAILAAAVYAGVMFAQTYNPSVFIPLAVIFGGKFLIDLMFNIPLLSFFKKFLLLLAMPFIEIMHILYIVIIGPISMMGRYRWKGRKVRS